MKYVGKIKNSLISSQIREIYVKHRWQLGVTWYLISAAQHMYRFARILVIIMARKLMFSEFALHSLTVFSLVFSHAGFNEPTLMSHAIVVTTILIVHFN